MKPDTPVYVRYRDHVLFKNRQSAHVQPAICECVGWVCRENTEAILIVWDRCVPPFGGNKIQPESGLCILKSDILEIENISFQHHQIPSVGDHLLSGSGQNCNCRICVRKAKCDEKFGKKHEENGKT